MVVLQQTCAAICSPRKVWDQRGCLCASKAFVVGETKNKLRKSAIVRHFLHSQAFNLNPEPYTHNPQPLNPYIVVLRALWAAPLLRSSVAGHRALDSSESWIEGSGFRVEALGFIGAFRVEGLRFGA